MSVYDRAKIFGKAPIRITGQPKSNKRGGKVTYTTVIQIIGEGLYPTLPDHRRDSEASLLKRRYPAGTYVLRTEEKIERIRIQLLIDVRKGGFIKRVSRGVFGLGFILSKAEIRRRLKLGLSL